MTMASGYQEIEKKRRHILYLTFSRKLAQSLAGFLSGLGLSLIGYVPNVAQSAGTLLGIKGLLTLYPAVALTISLLIIGFMYKLTDEKHAEIMKDLNAKA
ncbi:hypothetical protein GCM10020331_081570 [Ectobacillus funiculus]